MNVVGQGPVVNLVGAVVEGLERLGVEQAHQKIQAVVVVGYDGVQSAFLFSQRVQVHIIPVCNGFDLRQIDGSQPHSGRHEDRF